jgi:hypothetical protein
MTVTRGLDARACVAFCYEHRDLHTTLTFAVPETSMYATPESPCGWYSGTQGFN